MTFLRAGTSGLQPATEPRARRLPGFAAAGYAQKHRHARNTSCRSPRLTAPGRSQLVPSSECRPRPVQRLSAAQSALCRREPPGSPLAPGPHGRPRAALRHLDGKPGKPFNSYREPRRCEPGTHLWPKPLSCCFAQYPPPSPEAASAATRLRTQRTTVPRLMAPLLRTIVLFREFVQH